MSGIFDFIFENDSDSSVPNPLSPDIHNAPQELHVASFHHQEVPDDMKYEDMVEVPEAGSGFHPEDVGNISMDYTLRKTLVSNIEEYLNESMALRPFLHKMRNFLCDENDHKEVYLWIVRSIIECGSCHRMSTFLEENGIPREEIDAAAAAAPSDFGDDEYGMGEKRKRRERKRVSISKGLRSPPNKWTKLESQRLIKLVFEYGDRSWKKIAEQLGGGKTGAQCAQHWKRVLSPEIRKGSWDDHEEEALFQLVAKHGQSWKNIAAEIKTRTDIQCRYQYQKAILSRQCDWLPQEDALLKKKVSLSLQERRPVAWTEVSKFIARAKLTKIPRTALECKERCGTLNNGVIPNDNSLVPVMNSNDSFMENSTILVC